MAEIHDIEEIVRRHREDTPRLRAHMRAKPATRVEWVNPFGWAKKCFWPVAGVFAAIGLISLRVDKD